MGRWSVEGQPTGGIQQQVDGSVRKRVAEDSGTGHKKDTRARVLCSSYDLCQIGPEGGPFDGSHGAVTAGRKRRISRENSLLISVFVLRSATWPGEEVGDLRGFTLVVVHLDGTKEVGSLTPCCMSDTMSQRSRFLTLFSRRPSAMILSARISSRLWVLEDEGRGAKIDAVEIAQHHRAGVVAGDGACPASRVPRPRRHSRFHTQARAGFRSWKESS